MSKTVRLGLVLDPEEKAAVTKLAELEGGLSYAALIRRLIREAASKHGLWKAFPSPVQNMKDENGNA